MSTRILRILLALVIVGLISALFIYNPQETTVVLGPDSQFHAPMALVLILTFVAGALFAAILAFMTQFRLSLMNWRERRLRNLQREHLKELVTIREQVALQKWDDARKSLSRILREDPDNAVARTLLATTIEALEGGRAALRILEEGRGRDLISAEWFLKASELQERDGNLTAALDNLNLLLQRDPNARMVLREAVRVSSQLGDFERAVQYQERLTRIVERARYVEEQNKLADLELQAALKRGDGERDAALDQILRRHRDFAPALRAKAALAAQRGEFDRATRDLTQAFVSSGSLSYLHEILKLWLTHGDPERAIRTLRSALRERDLPQARAYLAALLASMGMVDQSEKELATLSEAELNAEGLLLMNIAQARLLQGKGQPANALQKLSTAIQRNLQGQRDADAIADLLGAIDATTIPGRKLNGREQPSPQLSTP